MTEEARNLIAESLSELCILNLPKGKILFVPHGASEEQIETAISFFENVLKDKTVVENSEHVFVEIPFGKPQQ